MALNNKISRPVVYGALEDEIVFQINGINQELDATEAQIRPSGGVYEFQQDNVLMEVLSDSPLDTLLGAGAQEAQVVYATKEGELRVDIIELDGVTPVPLQKAAFRIIEASAYTTGTYTGTNIGTITVQVVTGAIEQCQVLPGIGKSANGIFYNPIGYECHLSFFSVNTEVDKLVTLRLNTREMASQVRSGAKKVSARIINSTSSDSVSINAPAPIPPDTDVFITGFTSQQGADANVSLRLQIRKL